MYDWVPAELELRTINEDLRRYAESVLIRASYTPQLRGGLVLRGDWIARTVSILALLLR